MQNKWDFKNFRPEEFNSPDLPGSGLHYMDTEFIRLLQCIRDKVGFPLVIVSGYRTPAHNSRIGGGKESAHLDGVAADIKYNNSNQLYMILEQAILYKFTRIGINRTTIHLDTSKARPQKVCWHYYK